MKLEVTIKDLGIIFVFDGSIVEAEEFAKALSAHDGEEHPYMILGERFSVYYDKSKWDVIET
jgi:hypothetical protein